MRRVILSVSFADTFRATLTSGLLVLGSLIILQTQLINSASAEVTFLNKWGSSGTGDGRFDDPWGIALSGMGQVYVVDFGNHRIQRFDADGNYETQWGSEGTGDGKFYYPSRIAITHTGQVYVVDYLNDRIQRFFDSEAWGHGTNTFVNDSAGPTSVAVGPGDILGSSLTLDASKGLVVGDTTTVNAGGTLSISGGILTTPTLLLDGGRLSAPDLSGINTLQFNSGRLNLPGPSGLTVAECSADMTSANRLPAQPTTRGLRCQCVPTPVEAARWASKLHLFCHDSPLRACWRTQIRLWGFAFDAGGLLYWCSNDPAAESGEWYLGNVGLGTNQ